MALAAAASSSTVLVKSVLAAVRAARRVTSIIVLHMYRARASSMTPKMKIKNSIAPSANSTAATPRCAARRGDGTDLVMALSLRLS